MSHNDKLHNLRIIKYDQAVQIMKGEMGKMEIREMYTKVKLDNRMEKKMQEAQVQTGNHTNMDLKGTGCDTINCIQLTTGLEAGCCIISNENLELKKVGNILTRGLIQSF